MDRVAVRVKLGVGVGVGSAVGGDAVRLWDADAVRLFARLHDEVLLSVRLGVGLGVVVGLWEAHGLYDAVRESVPECREWEVLGV